MHGFPMLSPESPPPEGKGPPRGHRDCPGALFCPYQPMLRPVYIPLVAKGRHPPHCRTGSVFLRKQEGGGLTVVCIINFSVCDDP